MQLTASGSLEKDSQGSIGDGVREELCKMLPVVMCQFLAVHSCPSLMVENLNKGAASEPEGALCISSSLVLFCFLNKIINLFAEVHELVWKEVIIEVGRLRQIADLASGFDHP